MNKVKIVTDSSIQITAEEIKKYEIALVPLSIEIDGQQFIDGETITRQEFVQKMLVSKNLPKTSQPPLGRFVDTFKELGADGSKILAIHMTKGLSGTVEAARQAAQITGLDITVVDSGFTDRALAFQVIEAAKLAQSGADIADILPVIEKIKNQTHLYLGIPNLDNILNGGRLGKVAASLSTFLKINIVVQLKDSKLGILKKGRGIKTIENYMDKVVQQINEDGDKIAEIGISYVDDITLPNQSEQRIHEKWPQLPILNEVTSPVITTHAGKGAFAIMYYYR
ncbi:MAG: DegV family protein [Lactobacillus sp.]|uniref:DegV family protein n=1 Tax=Bombilactobacillus bombi TaxID=1303590 RepID=A0A347SRB3_9LACO|nr:DegV family protein [Bombilactobacillus bombi]AXX64572.1 DegV family protein [Bombilactobacillus bombi]MCO6541321.1 DegV family protein [Lactobacillus sp.]MCO6542866.1 DegV family protein [Lactobacillus sp.]RHW49893.1 DegV family protein [Bombilactobacillus bombi]